MMLIRGLCLVVCTAGCTSFKSDSDTGGAATNAQSAHGGGSTADVTDSIQNHGGLQDLTRNLDPSGCDTQESTGSELAGAAAYFYGVFVKDGANYSGFEQWIIFANETWREQGNADCIVQFNATGAESNSTAAAIANFGLDVTLTLNRGASTCPDELLEDVDDTSTEHYDIQISGDETRWYYSSGTQFGSGYANDQALNFITEKTCQWY